METKKVPAWLEHPAAFVKWLIFAGISGLLCGGVATAFYYAFPRSQTCAMPIPG